MREVISLRGVYNLLKGSESLLATKEILDEMGIEFFLTHGTLLGLVRNGFPIPYDAGRSGDVDLASFDEMPDSRFKEFTSVVEKHGLKMFLIQAKEVHGSRVAAAYIRGTAWYVGVEFWSKISDQRVAAYGRPVILPSKYFESPLKKIKHLGKEFNIPGDTEGLLEFNYGKNWKIPCVQVVIDNKKVFVKCDLSGNIILPVEVMDEVPKETVFSFYRDIPSKGSELIL